MTPQEFLTAIETYYNQKYEVTIEIKSIVDFLNSRLPLEQIEIFFHKVTDFHSKKWKSLPDKSIMLDVLEKHSGNWTEIQAEKAWRELLRNNTAHNVLIVDPISYFIVSGFGSWDRFCNERDGEYRELVHKDFINRYLSAARAGVNDTPKPLAGHYRLEYGPSFEGLKTEIIGDKEKGKLILSGSNEPSLIENLTGFIKQVEE